MVRVFFNYGYMFLNGIDNKRFAGLDADDNCEVAEENFVIMNEN